MNARARRLKQRQDDGTATIYARLSQDKFGDRLGVDRQLEECRTYCERLGWEIRAEYVDNDISATKGKRRPGFEELLASAPNRVVVWHTDRLVRLSRELERVIDLGVDVHSIQSGHLDLSSPTGRAVAKTITAWAEQEGEHKAERLRLKYEQMAQAGVAKWTHRPFGFEMSGKAHSTEAPLVAAIYQQALTGQSLAKVAQWLNSQQGGIPDGRKPWTGQAMSRFLKDARNCGILVRHGEEVGAGNWDALVPEITFRAVARMLGNPARRTGGTGRRRFLLTGLARCAECGAGVKGGTLARTGEYRGEPLYSCPSGHLALPVSWAEGRVFVETLRVLSSERNRAHWGSLADDEGGEVNTLQEERRLVMARFEELGEDYAAGRIARPVLLAGSDRAQVRLGEIDNRLATLGGAATVVAYFDTEAAAERLASMPMDEHRALIASVAEVTMHRRGRGVRGLRRQLVTVRAKS